MSDIFVSYASPDRALAQRLASLFEARGWQVWWDRSIPLGTSFDEAIEQALDHARCVVVLWSNVSVTSRWVKAEAAEGARRGILIPVIIDDVVPPLEFRRMQAADLRNWNGLDVHPGAIMVLDAVKENVNADRIQHAAPAEHRERLNVSKVSRMPLRSRISRRSGIAGILTTSALIAAAGLFTMNHHRAANFPSRPIHSLAVLPLRNLTGDPQQEYLADGVTDALITSLSQLAALRVIAHDSVLRYKMRPEAPDRIARDLKVESLVEGAILRHDDSIRIDTQLIDPAEGRNVWAESYDGEMRDVLSLQNDITRDITRAVRVTVSADEARRLSSRRVVDVAAHDSYLQGRALLRMFGNEETRRAITLFDSAIEHDPGYAPAYAGIAEGYYWLSNLYLYPTAAMPRARAAAVRALELDDSLGEAHAALALVKLYYEWDWAGAEREFKIALQLNPGYSAAHVWYGWMLMLSGRFGEDIAQFSEAAKLDPASPFVQVSIGTAYYFARQLDAALTHFDNAAVIDPTFYFVHWGRGWIHQARREYDAAITEFDKASEGGPAARARLGCAYAARGSRDEAGKIIAELADESTGTFVSGYDIATIYSTLGDKPAAWDALHKAVDQRAEFITWLKVDPAMDSLRDEPEYQELLATVRFPR